MRCVLCMQIKKLKHFIEIKKEMEGKLWRLGGCAEWNRFNPEKQNAERSMNVIGRPSIAAATLLFLSFLSSQYAL